MKHRNKVIGDDLDDHYLRGKDDPGIVYAVGIIIILVVLAFLTK